MRCALVLVAACGSDPVHHVDGSVPDATVDGGVDLSYITLSPGWHAEVWRDLTALIPYVDMQFIDGTEIYDNGIASPFVVQGVQGNSLGIVAGRDIDLVTDSSFVVHDYGEHAPNTTGLPDDISSALWMADTIVLSSSSLNAGDGVFTIAADWSIAQTLVTNNTRRVALDPTGAFDAIGAPRIYYSDQAGVYRLAGGTKIFAVDDGTSMGFHGSTLVYTNRLSDTEVDLYSTTDVAGAHPMTLLATSTEIGIGEGAPESQTGLGWAVIDEAAVSQIDTNVAGNLAQVAKTTDANYDWTGVCVPPSTHPLGQKFPSLYVTEVNRTSGLQRILRLTQQ